MTNETENKIAARLDDLHERLLHPDAGVFARLAELKHELTSVKTWAAKHDAADSASFRAIETRFDVIENRQSRFRGWLIGMAAGGGATGAAASKLLALIGS